MEQMEHVAFEYPKKKKKKKKTDSHHNPSNADKGGDLVLMIKNDVRA